MKQRIGIFGTITVLTFGLLLSVIESSPVQSQTTEDENMFESSIEQCIDDTKLSLPLVDGDKYVMTPSKLVDGAREKCCELTSQKRRRRCLLRTQKLLNRLRRKLSRRVSGAGSEVFEIGRNRVIDVRAADCADLGDYKALF